MAEPAMGLLFGRLGIAVQGLCIVLHFRFFPESLRMPRRGRGDSAKLLIVIPLYQAVTAITEIPTLVRQMLLPSVRKEAAHSSNMTFTLFDSPRHFPKCRPGRRNGILHSLS